MSEPDEDQTYRDWGLIATRFTLRWGCFIAGMSFACLDPPHHAHHVRATEPPESQSLHKDSGWP